MDYVEKLNIRDVLYLIHDLELRSSINKEELLDDEDQLPASNVVFEKLAEKANLQLFLDFINNSLATVATTGRYEDLIDAPTPGQGGPTVEGTALVFNSSSEGLTPEEVELLEAIIGSGQL